MKSRQGALEEQREYLKDQLKQTMKQNRIMRVWFVATSNSFIIIKD